MWAFPVLTYVFLVFIPAPAWSIAGVSSSLDFGNGWNQYHSRYHLSKPGSIFPALTGDGLGKTPPCQRLLTNNAACWEWQTSQARGALLHQQNIIEKGERGMVRILITEKDATMSCMIITFITYDKETHELWFSDLTDIWKTSICESTAMDMIRDLFSYGYLDASYLYWEMEE